MSADDVLGLTSDPNVVETDRETLEATRLVCLTMVSLAASGQIEADLGPMADVAVALNRNLANSP